MDEAWLLFRENKREGIVVCTQDQYQGRGRNGKPWIGKPGESLAFSVTLLPDIGTLLLLAPALLATPLALPAVTAALAPVGGRAAA